MNTSKHNEKVCGPHCGHQAENKFVYEYGRIAKAKPFCATSMEEGFLYNYGHLSGLPTLRPMEKMDTFNPHMVADSVCPR